MKVLFIADEGSVGGAAKALMEVALTLKNKGVEPVVCTSIYDDFNRSLENNGICNFACGHKPVMNTKSPYKWKRPLKYPFELCMYYYCRPKAIKAIEEAIDLNTVDIIHTNSARNDIGCFLSAKYNKPHIVHIREFGQEDFDCCIYRRNYYDFLNKYTTRFLAISKAVADSWIHKGIDKQKLQVLYDGVDIENIKVGNVNRFFKTDLRLIIAGGVCETKGQHIAISAVSMLPDEIKTNVTLDVVGWHDPRYVAKLTQMIRNYGIEQNVRILGKRDDLYEILKDYDVGLTCSKSEGFGRVTAEYMYAQLGVIASDTGACPELVEDNKSGLIYERNSAKALSESICKFYKDRDFLKACAVNAHIQAEYFSANRNAEDILNVYKEFVCDFR